VQWRKLCAFWRIFQTFFPRKILRIANLRACRIIFRTSTSTPSVTIDTGVCDIRHKGPVDGHREPQDTFLATSTLRPPVNITPLGGMPEMKSGARFHPSASSRCCFTRCSFEGAQNREVIWQCNSDADNLRLLPPCLRIFVSVCV
jgi:hypothetical protein